MLDADHDSPAEADPQSASHQETTRTAEPGTADASTDEPGTADAGERSVDIGEADLGEDSVNDSRGGRS